MRVQVPLRAPINTAARKGKLTLFNVKPAVGFTLPSAGVTPAPSDKKSRNGEDAIPLSGSFCSAFPAGKGVRGIGRGGIVASNPVPLPAREGVRGWVLRTSAIPTLTSPLGRGRAATASVLRAGKVLTRDVGGKASTQEVTSAIVKAMSRG